MHEGALAELARRIHLGSVLRLGRGEERCVVDAVADGQDARAARAPRVHDRGLVEGAEAPARVDVEPERARRVFHGRGVVAREHRDLEAEVTAGRFREDLLYRLNVMELQVPPLREHAEDIPALVRCFLERHCARLGRPALDISEAALAALQARPWPGNVRELENAVERAVVLTRDEWLDVADLPPAVRGGGSGARRISFEVGTPLKDVERRMIEETLRMCDGDKSLAASLMGITARTIYRREAEWAEDGAG